jgi:23S rRNA (guanosine2251-2'-O)-methyltransferase
VNLRSARVYTVAAFLLGARRRGLWSSAAAAVAGTAYDTADYRDGAVFVLGAEGRGLRPRVRSSCDQEVAIPLGGRIGSLNVSTAAAVLLFEACRQRRG